ncbi:DIE2/ALG10 family protein [Tanacetum coccineum]
MGFSKSKEDEVQKISTSVFVTNFPDNVGAKDLWHACKQYGHVIDVFIPDRRSKIGKRFGFVRFIKVFDVDRLVGNLCTVWIGKHRLHVNVARFSRPLLKNNRSFVNKEEQMRDKFNGEKKDSAERTSQNSYAYVVKGGFQANGEKDTAPVMVLDDSCVNQQDFSCCLNGKVKEFGVLVNLKIVIRNEGFSDVGLKYLGGLWVMLTFNSKEAKEKFLSCVAINTWFAQLIQASSELMIASRWGTLIDVDKSEDENFHSRRMCILTKGMTNVYETFKINHHGKVYWVRAKEISGWVPDFEEQSDEESDSDSEQSVQGFSEDIDGREEEQQVDDDISVVPDTIGTNARTKDDEGTASKEVMENQSSDPFEEGECDVNVHDNIASVDDSSATRCKKDGTESVGSGIFIRSANALSICNWPMLQGIVKLPGSFSFDGSLFNNTAEHLSFIMILKASSSLALFVSKPFRNLAYFGI